MRTVRYSGASHEVVREAAEVLLEKGKDWSVREKVSTPGVIYFHLRCQHPNACRDLEYVKKVRARRLKPGKTGNNDDDWIYFDRDEQKNAWIDSRLCEVQS